MLVDEILTLLRSVRFNWNTEAELQQGIETLFRRENIVYDREHRLSSKDRPDFWVDGIAIEVKIKGSATAMLLQIRRYAEHESIKAIIVITAKARHMQAPESLNGKPIYVHHLVNL